ncbi:hypothetical protein TREES_T100016014 [Tupaia chinensis]|uniref:Uncharacterized protein n=1 Tax=Tupaia chinensis TaxID=246437 RepID=L9KL10_TUPCH|nr:hypothetical protein TREES_T100016014 [Tupaia chinensis]
MPCRWRIRPALVCLGPCADFVFDGEDTAKLCGKGQTQGRLQQGRMMMRILPQGPFSMNAVLRVP